MIIESWVMGVSYESLRKIYYSNKENYENEYQNRFNADNAVRLDFRIKKNQAFFKITPEIDHLALSILTKDKAVMLLCKRLPGVARNQYLRDSLIEEIKHTNDIEGVRSTRKEITDAFEAINENNKSIRFRGIAHRYSRLLKEKEEIKTCQDVRKVYDDLLSDEIPDSDKPDGTIFRKGSVHVESATGKAIHEGIFPEEKIIQNMEQALQILNSEKLHCLYRVAVFHYLFGYIHPFYDGNGRLSRYISSAILSKDIEPIISCRLSRVVYTMRKEYYEAFEECNHLLNRGDVTSFVTMFLQVVLKAIENVEADLMGREEMMVALLQQFEEEIKLDRTYEYLILAALFSEEGISTKELAVIMGKSKQTISKRLNEIKTKGLLLSTRRGKEKCYKLDMSKI